VCSSPHLLCTRELVDWPPIANLSRSEVGRQPYRGYSYFSSILHQYLRVFASQLPIYSRFTWFVHRLRIRSVTYTTRSESTTYKCPTLYNHDPDQANTWRRVQRLSNPSFNSLRSFVLDLKNLQRRFASDCSLPYSFRGTTKCKKTLGAVSISFLSMFFEL